MKQNKWTGVYKEQNAILFTVSVVWFLKTEWSIRHDKTLIKEIK